MVYAAYIVYTEGLMPTITITLDVPEGVDITIARSDDDASTSDVERYYREYLSDNGRRIYRAAAEVEIKQGYGYTFDDIAAAADLEYESAKSMHRSTGRSAKPWTKDTGKPAPITLDAMEYDETSEGMRTTYCLPDGVAEQIMSF